MTFKKSLASILALPSICVIMIGMALVVIAVCVFAVAALLFSPAYFLLPKRYSGKKLKKRRRRRFIFRSGHVTNAGLVPDS